MGTEATKKDKFMEYEKNQSKRNSQLKEAAVFNLSMPTHKKSLREK